MFAAESSPKTFKEKRMTVVGKPGNIDYEQALANEIKFFTAEDDMIK